jgi:hypothetical protein
MARSYGMLFLVLGLALFVGYAGHTTDDGLPHGSSTGIVAGQQGSRVPGSLTTLFASNNGYAGNTFDIVPNRSIKITGIDVNVEPAGTSTAVDVYYLVGTSVGNENTSSAWTLLASGTGTAAGTDLPTFIDLPGASGVNFDGAVTYGIYVDISSYSSPSINYTNGQNTYSNADLSLITNTGQTSPAFTGSFFPRQWNGTLYYDDGAPDIARVDIKCNGADANVVVPASSPATVGFDLHAGMSQGVPADIWVIMISPFGNLSYNGVGPITGWHFGVNHAYYTGLMTNIQAIVLDRPVPAGNYIAVCGVEDIPNGQLDLGGALIVFDQVDFLVQ